jgi:hypothetical protein
MRGPIVNLRFYHSGKKIRLTHFSASRVALAQWQLVFHPWGQLCGYAMKAVDFGALTPHFSEVGFSLAGLQVTVLHLRANRRMMRKGHGATTRC